MNQIAIARAGPQGSSSILMYLLAASLPRLLILFTEHAVGSIIRLLDSTQTLAVGVEGWKMSVELPEAKILAEQMNEELGGKRVRSYHLQDCVRLQKTGMLNKDLEDFDQLVDGEIEFVASRGNVIHMKLDNGTNLILDPEYGGEILYHRSGKNVTSKYHLRIDFSDDTVLTVRLTSIGVIQTMGNGDLQRCYVYRRDFNPREVLTFGRPVHL